MDVRAAGIHYPMSGGWMDIYDLDGLRASAQQAKRLGYTGMHLIHPSPRPRGQRGIYPHGRRSQTLAGPSAGHGATAAQGGAAVTYDGDMVDIAHEETARSMLAMAREMGVSGA